MVDEGERSPGCSETVVLTSNVSTYFMCGICKTFFSGKQDLLHHELEVHFEEGEGEFLPSFVLQGRANLESKCDSSYFLCEICENFFDNNEEFLHHQTEVHCSSGRPLNCSRFPCEGGYLLDGPELSCGSDSYVLHFKEKTLVSDCAEDNCELLDDIKVESAEDKCDKIVDTEEESGEGGEDKTVDIKHEENASVNSCNDHLRTISCEHCCVPFTDGAELRASVTPSRLEDTFTCDRYKEEDRATHGRSSCVGEPRFSCDVCGREFLLKRQLQSHRRVHSGDLSCNYCGKCFSRYYLNAHVKTHLEQRPHLYMCEYCGKTFAVRGYLSNHIATHIVERSLECDYCGKMFASKYSLRFHIRGHMGIRPFKCKMCTKSFSYSSNLTYHERTHTGDRPFKCKICRMSFMQHTHLANHTRTHTGERKFVCSQCSSAFTRKCHLLDHIAKKH